LITFPNLPYKFFVQIYFDLTDLCGFGFLWKCGRMGCKLWGCVCGCGLVGMFVVVFGRDVRRPFVRRPTDAGGRRQPPQHGDPEPAPAAPLRPRTGLTLQMLIFYNILERCRADHVVVLEKNPCWFLLSIF